MCVCRSVSKWRPLSVAASVGKVEDLSRKVGAEGTIDSNRILKKDVICIDDD